MLDQPARPTDQPADVSLLIVTEECGSVQINGIYHPFGVNLLFKMTLWTPHYVPV